MDNENDARAIVILRKMMIPEVAQELDIPRLKAIRELINEAISELKQEAEVSILEEMANLLRAKGLDPAQLHIEFTPEDEITSEGYSSYQEPRKGKHKKKRDTRPKWRNPNDPEQTYNGWGRKPSWFEEMSEEERNANRIVYGDNDSD